MNGRRFVAFSAVIVLVFTAFAALYSFLPLRHKGLRISAGKAEYAQILKGGDSPQEPGTRFYLLPGETIDINAAGAAELEKLTGIGPALADAIISYREANGPFQTPEDIMNVPGIGQKRYDAIKDDISTG